MLYHFFLTSIHKFLMPYIVYMSIILAVLYMLYIYFAVKNYKMKGHGKTYLILALLGLPYLLAAQTDSTSFQFYLFGSIPLSKYMAGYLFAFAAIGLRALIKLKKGLKEKNERSPNKFSGSFWIKDNLIRILSSIAINFIILTAYFRFTPDIVEYLNIPFGSEFTMFSAFVIGLGIDFIIDKINGLQPDISKRKDSE